MMHSEEYLNDEVELTLDHGVEQEEHTVDYCIHTNPLQSPRAAATAVVSIHTTTARDRSSATSSPRPALGGSSPSSQDIIASPKSPAQQAIPSHAMTNSSAHGKIFRSLQQLWEDNCDSIDVSTNDIVRYLISTHGTPCIISLACFLIVLLLPESYSFAFKFTSIFVFAAIVAAFSVIEGFFIWARAVEIRYRCMMAVHDLVSRQNCGFAGQMRGLRGLATAHSFRPQHVVRDGKLNVIPKALVVQGDVVLDMRKMQYRFFQKESVGVCKLYDSLLLAIRGEARMLRPLKHVARSLRPRYTLPHSFPQQNNKSEEDVESTDESDGAETDCRSRTIGGALPSIPRQMEYFVRRSLLLMWFILFALLFFVGIIRGLRIGSFSDNILFYPCICVLALLPLNAMLLHRIMALFGNAVLSLRIKWLVEQDDSMLHEECEVPVIPLKDVAKELASVISAIKKGCHEVMCFSRSPMETFGTVTVVSVADSEGILTDIVPVPHMILLINRNENKDYSDNSSSSSEDDEDVNDAMGRDYMAQVREAKIKMHLQKRRRLFQEDRFTQLDLHVSTLDDLAVEFLDDRLKQTKLPCLNPMALCALLHSVHSTCFSSDAASATARHMDRTVLWARCLHWLPRSLSFDDVVACQYRLLRRIVFVNSVGAGKKTDQCCGLLFLFENEFHLFTLSSLRMALPRCSSYWTGTDIEEFDDEEKRELFTVANDQWGKKQLSTVCLSHRVLPARYKKYIEVSDRIAEDVFFNGELMTDEKSAAKTQRSQRRQNRRKQQQQQSPKVAQRRGGIRKSTSNTVRFDDEDDNCSSCSSMNSVATTTPTTTTASTTSSSFCSSCVNSGCSESPSEVASNNGSSTKDSPQQRRQSGRMGHDNKAAAKRRSRRKRMTMNRTKSDSDLFKQSQYSQQQQQEQQQQQQKLQHRRRQHQRSHSQYDSESDLHDGSSLQKDSALTRQNFVKSLMSCDQTLLGVVGLRDNVRPNVEASISVLQTAGIRFSIFGHDNESHTKSFGHRVGLEAEWNSCISLQSKSVDLDETSIRAQLPYGIENIRHHISSVDPIPLQVSMFSHSRSVSTRNMISILQDNHEVVCFVGSPYNHANIRCFLQGDISIGVVPSTTNSALDKADFVNRPGGDDDAFFTLEPSSVTGDNLRKLSKLIGSCTAMTLPCPNALPITVILIRESRLLLKAVSQATEFVVQCNCVVAILHVFVFLLGLPTVLSSVQTMWTLYAVFPMLSIGTFYINRTHERMFLPTKHNFIVRRDMFLHVTRVFLMRYTPTVLLLIITYLVSVASVAQVPLHKVMYQPSAAQEWLATGEKLGIVRSIVAVSLVYLCSFHALTHVARHQYATILWGQLDTSKAFLIFRCPRWFLASTAVFILNLLFLELASPVPFYAAFQYMPTPLLLFVLMWPFLVIAPIDYQTKQWRLRRYNDIQKFRRLYFTTRLGMHSPRGDWEPPRESTSSDKSSQDADAPMGRFESWFFEWTTIQQGRMERNCVCCPHPPSP